MERGPYKCDDCDGTGMLDNQDICPACHGEGVVDDDDDQQPTEQEEWLDYDRDC